MKARHLLLVVVLVIFVASAASAATYGLKLSNLTSRYWTKVVTHNSGEPYTDVVEATADDPFNQDWSSPPVGYDDFQFRAKLSGTGRDWAGIGTNYYAGKRLGDITTLKIQNHGCEGVGTSWMPPTVQLVIKTPDNNFRVLTYVPWALGASYRNDGVDAGSYVWDWRTWDTLTTSASWVDVWTGATRQTWAQLMATYANATIVTGAETPTGALALHPSKMGVNLMVGSWISNEDAYFNDVAGHINTLEIAFNSQESHIWDLNSTAGAPPPPPAVPEPAGLAALAAGMVGLMGLRRRK